MQKISEKPLWKRIGLHKQKNNSDNQRSFKKLEILSIIQPVFKSPQSSINANTILDKKVDIQTKKQEIIEKDPLFESFYQQYKQLNQSIIHAEQIIITSQQLEQNFIKQTGQIKIDDHQQNHKEKLMQSLIQKIRKSSNQLQQNNEFLESINKKVLQVGQINIAQLKNILHQMFIVLRKNFQNMKNIISKERNNFKQTIERIIPEIQDYIELRKILTNKNYGNMCIQTSEYFLKDESILSLGEIENVNNFENSIVDQYKKIFNQKTQYVQLIELTNNELYSQNQQIKKQLQIIKTNLQVLQKQKKQLVELTNKLKNEKLAYQIEIKQNEQLMQEKLANIQFQLEEKHNINIQYYTHQLKQKIKQIQILQQQIKKLKQQNSQYHHQISVLKRKPPKFQLVNLNQKIEKLTSLHKLREQQLSLSLQQLNRQNYSMKNKIDQLQLKHKKSIEQYKKEIQQTKNENYSTLQQNFSLLQKLQSLQFQYEQKLEIARKKQIKQNKQKIDKLIIQNNYLKQRLSNITTKTLPSQKLQQFNNRYKYKDVRISTNKLITSLRFPSQIKQNEEKGMNHRYRKSELNQKRQDTQFYQNQDYIYNPITNYTKKQYLNQNLNKNNEQIFDDIYEELGNNKKKGVNYIYDKISMKQKIKTQNIGDYNFFQRQRPQKQKIIFSSQYKFSKNFHQQTNPRKSYERSQFAKIQHQLSNLTKQLKIQLQSIGSRTKR